MSNHQFCQENPPLVLAVDTSSACAGFSIASGQEIIASIKTDAPVPHSKTFFNHLSALLKEAGKSLSEIDGFAAATGPGSFTGLRVGLSAINGLSHAVCKPAIGISTIDALALASKAFGKFLVIINAGRDEVYAGLRQIQSSGILEVLGTDIVGPVSSVTRSFDQFIQDDKPFILTTGFNSEQDCSLDLESGVQIIHVSPNLAEEIAVYATQILTQQTSFDLRPHYIRPSDAEIKRL
jgi:tRNA threonylcarbamoyl adenosine modification protein YeaZ